MDKKTASKLITKTKDDYNLIAEQFSSTRQQNWGEVGRAIKNLNIHNNDRILDLGCGNGRTFDLLKNSQIKYYGLDLSEELIKIAKISIPKGKFTVGDLLQTPYRENEFNVVLCIAALHHIPSKESRRQAMREIYRITKPEGKILITTWYFWNKPHFVKGILKVAFRIIQGKSELDFGDFMMPWKTGDGKMVTKRYFHAWRKIEMKSYLKKAGFKNIKILPYPGPNKKLGRNLLITAEK